MPPSKLGPSLPGCSLGEYPRQHYPTQSQVPYGMQPPRQHEVRLVITRILRPLHAPRPGGRRFPPPRFRSASPPPASPQRSSAPRPAASCSCLTSCLRPPRIPSRCSGNCASGASNVSSTSEARAATSEIGVRCRILTFILLLPMRWPGCGHATSVKISICGSSLSCHG